MMKCNGGPFAEGQESIPRVGSAPPEIRWDDGLGFRTITGEITPGNELLKLIAEALGRRPGISHDHGRNNAGQ